MNSPNEQFILRKTVSVRPLPNFRLAVATDTGEELLLDLERLVMSRNAFWRLRNECYFKMAMPDENGVVCWPEGEDLAPDGLDRYRVDSVNDIPPPII